MVGFVERRRVRGQLEALRHLWPQLTRPGSVHRHDASVMASINAKPLSKRLPPGLTVRWLGVAGFDLQYEGYHLIIDPYLSRAPLRQVALGDALVSDSSLLLRHVPRADAVLVGHTHFDHAVDVAALCRLHSCPAYGSTSLSALMRLHRLDHLAYVPVPHRVVELGPFNVRFVPSRHSPLLLGLAVPFSGEITCEHLGLLGGRDYRCGQVYGIHIEVAGTTFYHQGSAEILEEEVRQRQVDYLLTCIAGRSAAPDYLRRTVSALDPKVVIAHHHDNFFLPIDGPAGFSFNVNCEGFVEDVRRLSADLEVRAFSPLQVIGQP